MYEKRYCLVGDKVKDTKSGFILPDLYWIVDLLNLKEDRINELESMIEE